MIAPMTHATDGETATSIALFATVGLSLKLSLRRTKTAYFWPTVANRFAGRIRKKTEIS